MPGPVFYNSQQYAVRTATTSQAPVPPSQISAPTYANPDVNLAMNGSHTLGALAFGQQFGSLLGVAAQAYADMILNDGPVVYYRCNDTGTTLADIGPHNLNGTIGASCTVSQAALIGGDTGAASLETPGGTFSASICAEVSQNSLLEPSSNEITLEAWINIPSTPGSAFLDLVGYSQTSGTEKYMLSLGTPASTVEFFADDGSGGTHGSPRATYTPNVPFHLVGQYSKSNGFMSLYFNGVLVGTNASNNTSIVYNGTGKFIIGASQVTAGVNAYFAEVAMYNYILTPAQILNHYNTGASFIPSRLSRTPTKIETAAANIYGQQSSVDSGASDVVDANGNVLATFAYNPSGVSVITKKVSKFPPAILSFLGNLGSIFTGSGPTFSKAFSATLVLTGTMQNATMKALTGTASFAGTQVRAITHGISSAVLSFSGAAIKAATHGLTAAALSFAGSVRKLTTLPLVGGLSFAGAIAMLRFKLLALAASLSFAGSQAKFTTYQLAANLLLQGALHKALSRAAAATLSFVGGVTRAIGKAAFNAGLSFVGAVALLRFKLITLVANLSFAGSQAKATAHQLAANTGLAGAMVKAVSRPLTATLSFAGGITRAVRKAAFAAALTFTGGVTTLRFKLLNLAANLSFNGAGPRRAGKAPTANLSFTGAQGPRALTKAFAAATRLGGSLSKGLTRAFGAVMALVGAFLPNRNLPKIPVTLPTQLVNTLTVPTTLSEVFLLDTQLVNTASAATEVGELTLLLDTQIANALTLPLPSME